MSLKAGIIGLPNVGKSTLFNAMTAQDVIAENYPFATIEPNVGSVELNDPRLTFLVNKFKSRKVVPAIFQFVDIAGLVRGASQGQGLGNQFLGHIREVDAICEVVRLFPNNNIVHVEGGLDPVRDCQIIDLELIYSDQETVKKRIAKLGKKAKSGDKEAIKEIAFLEKLADGLRDCKPARAFPDLSEDEEKWLKDYQLLSSKPLIYVANVGEDQLANYKELPQYKELEEYASNANSKIVVICCSLEAELKSDSFEVKHEFLEQYNLKQSGLESLSQLAYNTLGLETFFTAGPKEAHAWTFIKGSTAYDCAGLIHSDIQKGFIKAEIYSYFDLEDLGDVQAIKAAGKIKIEGRNYIVQDGDVCYFNFR